MSLRWKWRASLCALSATVCAIAASGCASWQGPRIDPSGERVLLWPGQAPPVVAPPAATPFAVTAAPGIAPPPPTSYPPVISNPLPSVGLPTGNLQAAPVYSDAGLTPTPPPVITVPTAPPPMGAPAFTTPSAAVPIAPPPSVDAQWAFPASTIAQAGHPLVLTTIVTRRSDRAPLPGWIVRYEVTTVGASFGPSGGNRVEVPTDASGRASIEISPVSVGAGEAVVNMTVVQPSQLVVAADALSEVGRGAATITWKDGVPGAPPWIPTAATAPLSNSQPAMSAPSLAESSPWDTTPSGPTYGDERPPNRFEPPPSLPNDTPPKTYAPPPPLSKQEPQGKPELVVEVRRRGPEEVMVGGYATFEVIVTNRGDATARGIKVLDRFDPGLSHVRAVDNELAVKYESMRDLEPGESATVPLTFGVRAAGRQCHEATVTAEGAEAVIESGCITAIEDKPTSLPTLEVTKQGPTRHYVGEIAKFRIVIKNTGDVPVTNLVVTDHYDLAFKPLSTDSGREILPDGSFQWRIPRLEKGERREINVHCTCVTPAGSACSRASVSADGDVHYADDKCVEILGLNAPAPTTSSNATPPPPLASENLKLSMSATANPARVGTPMLLFVNVENTGHQAERNVTLRVLVPQEMTPDSAQIKPLGTSQVVGKEVRFGDVGELRPGEKREFEIPLAVERTGTVTFWAEVTAAGLATPITSESNRIQIESSSQ